MDRGFKLSSVPCVPARLSHPFAEVPMSIARLLPLSVALAAVPLVPHDARGQNPTDTPPPVTVDAVSDSGSWANRLGRRLSGSVGLLQMRPLGEFRQYVGLSYGVGGDALLRLDRRGILALRAELGWIDYGEESKRVPLSPTVGGRVQVDVKTMNQILLFFVGPQVSATSGFIRPYTGATLGLTHFFTTSGVDGADDTYGFANTTNFGATKLAWTGHSGVYIPLHYGKTPVLLDIGVRYVGSGRLIYLRPGSIVDQPDNRIDISPVTSETRFLAYRIGVKLGR